MRLAFLALLAVLPAVAQRDFLTADEIDQLRLAQEPDTRLPLYLKFAQQRLDLLEQWFARHQTGRSGMIHDTLEQLTQIIEAIDSNIDDAIRRQKPMTSLAGIAKAEKEMLARLEKFAGSEAPDKARYEFALEQAIETLRDSAELSEQDVKERTHAVEEREQQIRKEREELLSPERRQELLKEKTKIDAEKQGVAPGKKKPTLLKPGEKTGPVTQPAQPPKK